MGPGFRRDGGEYLGIRTSAPAEARGSLWTPVSAGATITRCEDRLHFSARLSVWIGPSQQGLGRRISPPL